MVKASLPRWSDTQKGRLFSRQGTANSPQLPGSLSLCSGPRTLSRLPLGAVRTLSLSPVGDSRPTPLIPRGLLTGCSGSGWPSGTPTCGRTLTSAQSASVERASRRNRVLPRNRREHSPTGQTGLEAGTTAGEWVRAPGTPCWVCPPTVLTRAGRVGAAIVSRGSLYAAGVSAKALVFLLLDTDQPVSVPPHLADGGSGGPPSHLRSPACPHQSPLAASTSGLSQLSDRAEVFCPWTAGRSFCWVSRDREGIGLYGHLRVLPPGLSSLLLRDSLSRHFVFLSLRPPFSASLLRDRHPAAPPAAFSPSASSPGPVAQTRD